LIKDGWKLEFEFQYTGPMEYFTISSKAAFEQKTIVRLIPNEPATLEEFLDVHHHFQKFLGINYFQVPAANEIEFFIKKTVVEEHESDHVKVQYVAGSAGQENANYKPHHDRSNFLLRYKDYDGNFDDRLQQWFSLEQKLEASINMLSEALMRRGLPVEFYFTGMVQAMENLHRKTIGGDITLRKRIKALLAQLSAPFLQSILHNEPAFVDRLVKNRNHYTHHESRDENFQPASLSELFVLAEKCKILLITLVLQTVGFTQEKAERQVLAKSVWLFNHLVKVSEAKDGYPDIAEQFHD
jgi:hypothetical protein